MAKGNKGPGRQMRYKGGKNNQGVYQRLITLIPPHRLYVEAFAGSAAILRRKRPAEKSIAYELDRETIAELSDHLPAEHFEPWRLNSEWQRPNGPLPGNGGTSIGFREPGTDRTNLEIHNVDAMTELRKFVSGAATYAFYDPKEIFIYLDPPYPDSVRSSPGKIYKFEMMAEAEHAEMLDLIEAIPARVMLSGYDNDLYNRRLKKWRVERIPTTNRAGKKVMETVWLNFPDPGEVFDCQHVGGDFRQRWNITKRVRNWTRLLDEMDAGTRAAVLEGLAEVQAEYLKGCRAADARAMETVARSARAALKRLDGPKYIGAAKGI